ncbi:LCP family protein [Paenibacillus thalictri]|uniref:LytR family transcriptional regulator n=1 Tax=Paenibacillus thalictri TaxID=2527873 RepID=A0A4Q9DER3_9BACL|nr:LCP family protein [Paenibacillus thalictri]TBL69392.1 LytR family transcriptional regulator [Paenibacillus thalictri]
MARKIKWVLLTFLLLVLAVIGYYTYYIVQFANHIQSKPNDTMFPTVKVKNIQKSETFAPPKWEGKERVNVLLLGGDSRGLKKNEVPRSDSMMVASIDPVTKKSYLFSILRDTYVKIPSYGEDRINTALALGGPDLAMKTVSDLLGIPIQYYVYTDFVGFIALVDAIGGIDLDVEKNMKYSDSEDDHIYDIDLKKGMQHMNGKTALQYVRFRHDALSDFARTERQRKFLQAVAQKMQTTSSLLKLPRILSSIDPYIETNITTTDMLKLGSLAYDVKADGIAGEQIPPTDLLVEKNIGGAAVISADKNKLKAYVQDLLIRGPKTDSTKQTTAPSGTGSVTGTPATNKK